MGWMFGRSAGLVPEGEMLKGGSYPVLESPEPHAALGTPITGPWKDNQEVVYIGIGYYQGAEKLFWETPDMLSTSVGFVDGMTLNPTYRESCTGHTNHTKIVEVVYDPEQINFDRLIVKAFETHGPTQGYRQGNNIDTQYRSAIYTTTPEQARRAQGIADAYAPELAGAGLSTTTIEVKPLSETPAGKYYRARGEHQQYLLRNPNGYCPVHSTSVACGI